MGITSFLFTQFLARELTAAANDIFLGLADATLSKAADITNLVRYLFGYSDLPKRSLQIGSSRLFMSVESWAFIY